MPKVSVIIPCFNAENFIGDSVRSALQQTLTDIEVIIVDDASTDNSKRVIAGLADSDKRIVPLYLKDNGGPSVARNAGIEAASGTWLAVLDADDLFHPERLQRLVDIAEENDADLVADNQSVRDFGSDVHVFSAYSFAKQGEIVHLDSYSFFDLVWLGYNKYDIGLMKPLMRIDFLRKNRIKYDASHRIGEDFLLYVTAIAKGGRFFVTGDSFYIYHRRQGSISREGSPAFKALADMVDIILNDEEIRLDKRSIRLMENRKTSLYRIVHWRTLRRLKSERKWREVLEYAMKHPSSLTELIKQRFLWQIRRVTKSPNA